MHAIFFQFCIARGGVAHATGVHPTARSCHGCAGDQVQRSGQRLLARYHNDALSDFMNGPVRERVGIIPANVTWCALDRVHGWCCGWLQGLNAPT